MLKKRFVFVKTKSFDSPKIINSLYFILFCFIIVIFISCYLFKRKNKEIYKVLNNDNDNNNINNCNDERNIFSQYPYIEYEEVRPWKRFDSLKY